jgi:hypothetical protein
MRIVFVATFLALSLGACSEAPPIITSTTVLESTADTVGPYVVQSVIIDAGDHAVELRYRIDDDLRYLPVPMTADSDGELHSGAIPGRPAGTRIAYYVTVLSGSERIVDDPEGAGAGPYTFTILPANDL